jgi:hypothetical protein
MGWFKQKQKWERTFRLRSNQSSGRSIAAVLFWLWGIVGLLFNAGTLFGLTGSSGVRWDVGASSCHRTDLVGACCFSELALYSPKGGGTSQRQARSTKLRRRGTPACFTVWHKTVPGKLIAWNNSSGPPFLPFGKLFGFRGLSMKDLKDLSPLHAATASSLMAGALQAALIQSLLRKQIITDEEGREIYEQALLMLETTQARASTQEVFEAARELIEQHLRRH